MKSDRPYREIICISLQMFVSSLETLFVILSCQICCLQFLPFRTQVRNSWTLSHGWFLLQFVLPTTEGLVAIQTVTKSVLSSIQSLAIHRIEAVLFLTHSELFTPCLQYTKRNIYSTVIRLAKCIMWFKFPIFSSLRIYFLHLLSILISKYCYIYSQQLKRGVGKIVRLWDSSPGISIWDFNSGSTGGTGRRGVISPRNRATFLTVHLSVLDWGAKCVRKDAKNGKNRSIFIFYLNNKWIRIGQSTRNK